MDKNNLKMCLRGIGGPNSRDRKHYIDDLIQNISSNNYIML
jgi:hypothetical protein